MLCFVMVRQYLENPSLPTLEDWTFTTATWALTCSSEICIFHLYQHNLEIQIYLCKIVLIYIPDILIMLSVKKHRAKLAYVSYFLLLMGTKNSARFWEIFFILLSQLVAVCAFPESLPGWWLYRVLGVGDFEVFFCSIF